jgi:hypothetical protein
MKTRSGAARRLEQEVIDWRRDQLIGAGLTLELASRVADDDRFDLHALIELIERGCAPALAVRIVAPLESAPDGG